MRAEWHTAKLRDVCTYINRGISPRYIELGGIRVLNQKCIRDHHVSYAYARRHDEAAKAVAADRFIRIDDVLVNSTGTGTLGRVAQVREAPHEPTTVDSHVTIVRPQSGRFYPPLFGHMFVAIEDLLKQAGEGCGGQTELARSALANDFHVRFPIEIAEQRRLAALLDEAFAGIATARANAERNLRNARALFESQLASCVDPHRTNWPQSSLGDTCATSSGGTPLTSRAEYYDGGTIPWLTSGEVGQGEVHAATRFITEQGLAGSSAKLFPAGTVLVAMYGATAGQVGLLRFKAATNQAVCGIFPSEHFSPEFLYYLFCAKREDLIAQATGNAQPNISQLKIRNTAVPLVPRAEQDRIAATLARVSDEVRRLEQLYRRKLAALDALKQSLLHHAFTGQLTERTADALGA